MSDMKTKHQTLRDNGINIDQLNEDKPLLVKTILSSMVEYAQLFHEYKLANDTKKEQNTLPIDIVSGSYYWVKCFTDDKYEPTIAVDHYNNRTMYFRFSNGAVRECDRVADYKELNYR